MSGLINRTAGRRGVLRSILTAGAIAALPTAAVSAAGADQVGGDAALFALLATARDLQAQIDAANDACGDAFDRTEVVQVPRAMIATESDLVHWPLAKVGSPFSEHHIASIVAFREICHGLDLRVMHDPRLAAAFGARADELVAAFDQLQAARLDAKKRSGVLAADLRAERLEGEEQKLRRRIATTPARTTAGMLAKLDYVAPYFSEDDLSEGNELERILASVAIDRRALHPSPAA